MEFKSFNIGLLMISFERFWPIRYLGWAGLLLLISAFCQYTLGQSPAKSPSPYPERSKEILKILGNARLAAPEMAVDIFIKTAQSKKVVEQAWRREILDEAFRISDDVKNPVRRKTVPFSGVPVDTHGGYRSNAYDLKLDQLSLKSRIITEFLKSDKERAKQIVFQMGGSLGLKPLKCEDVLVYDVSDIYVAVGRVANTLFTKTEIDEGHRALFLLPWFENIESPAQIGPALNLLSEMRGSPAEKQLLFSAFTKALSRSFNDDRSFSYVINRDQLVAKIARIVSGVGDDHLKAELISSFKGFLIKNLNSTRCEDSEFKDKEIPSYLNNANFLFPEKPLIYEDVVYSDLKGSPEIKLYWKSISSLKLQNEIRELRSTGGKDANSKGKTDAAELAIKVNSFVDNLDSWKASDAETESEVFNQKCVLFRTLIGQIEDSSLKKSIGRRYIRYLGNSPIQKENFIEWMYHINWLLSSNPQIFSEFVSESPNSLIQLIFEVKRLGF